ncbi:glycosyltransferase [Weissella diestrammenae]|uniref:Glycosyltransferase n=1 Tax=Weissella diestrammenae TaxID=1162633 RepID=A0A7G9T3K3_9LACO|nr:glycosyltransferase [Weissella diestrammenae]MCM0582649.1 glycosyltransferase [Weissella diestrammenae]QNN74678.1 glycosyltransferase [Weissella diestrammenae]
MNLFVSENIFAFNSGTEHAQARRTRLFNEQGEKALYVTRDYNRFLDRDLHDIGLSSDQVLNMYDFFQGTTQVVRQEQNLRLIPELPLDTYHITGQGPNYSTLDRFGQQIARINVMPATVGLVNDITYNDRAGNPTIRENWDWRGFKSSIDTFHADGQVGVQRFLNQAEVPVLEVLHMNVNGQLFPTMWKLLDYQGKQWRFNTENELFVFFLEALTKQYPNSVLISDRRSLDGVISEVSGAGQKMAYFHDIHTPDAKKPRTGKPYPAYELALDQRKHAYDMILVPTKAQRDDLKARYPDLTVKAAPNTFVSADLLANNRARVDSGITNRVLYLGRLSPEKRPEDAIRALAALRKTVPDATLELMGYATDAEYEKKLQRLVAELQLTPAVIFTPYGHQAEVSAALSRAQILVQTSVGEGLGMNLVEGLSYGLPIVSYDINYTTNDTSIVEDGVNGFVVPNAAYGTLGAKVAIILQDAILAKQMKQASFDKAEAMTADKMFAEWQAVLG